MLKIPLDDVSDLTIAIVALVSRQSKYVSTQTCFLFMFNLNYLIFFHFRLGFLTNLISISTIMPKVVHQTCFANACLLLLLSKLKVKGSKTLFTMDIFWDVRGRKGSKKGTRTSSPYIEFVLVGWRRKCRFVKLKSWLVQFFLWYKRFHVIPN